MNSNTQTFDDLDAIMRKLRTARVQSGRLKNKPAVGVHQAAVDAAAEKVKSLEKQGDDLYIGQNGIGRRKNARIEPIELVKCPICLDNIDPYEQIRISFCYPVPHKIHRDCWLRQPPSQRLRCCVCRQFEVTLLKAVVLYGKFPTGQRDFNPYAFLRAPAMDWFNHAGVGVIRSFVREEISSDTFMDFVCHPYTPVECRLACKKAFDCLSSPSQQL